MALQISGSRYLRSISEGVLWIGSYPHSASLLLLNEYFADLLCEFDARFILGELGKVLFYFDFL